MTAPLNTSRKPPYKLAGLILSLLTIGAIWFSHPVGLKLQEHFTTLGDPGDLEVLGVKRESLKGLKGNPLIVYRVHTTSS